MRTDEALKILQERGSEGISSAELAEMFGFKIPGSVSKILKHLKEAGHDIRRDSSRKVFYLVWSHPSSTGSPTEKKSQNTKDYDDVMYKALGKRERILECLIRAGSEGATVGELAKYTGVSEKNICFHIHALRRKDFHKISLIDGKYIVKATKKAGDTYGKGFDDIKDVTAFSSIIDNKRLSDGIKIIRPEDLPAYLDLLKKVVYYTRCAIAMVETSEMIHNLTIGDQ